MSLRFSVIVLLFNPAFSALLKNNTYSQGKTKEKFCWETVMSCHKTLKLRVGELVDGCGFVNLIHRQGTKRVLHLKMFLLRGSDKDIKKILKSFYRCQQCNPQGTMVRWMTMREAHQKAALRSALTSKQLQAFLAVLLHLLIYHYSTSHIYLVLPVTWKPNNAPQSCYTSQLAPLVFF